MRFLTISLLTISLVAMAACSSDNDALKRGLYEGMKSSNKANDPGLGDTLPPAGNEMSYDEYQGELKKK